MRRLLETCPLGMCQNGHTEGAGSEVRRLQAGLRAQTNQTYLQTPRQATSTRTLCHTFEYAMRHLQMRIVHPDLHVVYVHVCAYVLFSWGPPKQLCASVSHALPTVRANVGSCN